MMTVFEKIINKEIDAQIVYEDTDFLVFKDIAPLAPVHLLVIPKVKSEDAPDIMNYDLSNISALFEVIKKIAVQYGIDKTGYRIVTNSGNDAGQTVQHLHFHILGGQRLGKPC